MASCLSMRRRILWLRFLSYRRSLAFTLKPRLRALLEVAVTSNLRVKRRSFRVF